MEGSDQLDLGDANAQRAWPVIEDLTRSGFVEQLPRSLAERYQLPETAAEESTALALDQLAQRLSSGFEVRNPKAWVLAAARQEGWRIVRAGVRAFDAAADRYSIDQGLDHADGIDGTGLARALDLVARYVPRISQEKPRLAMELVFDALRAGNTSVVTAHEVGDALGITRRYADEVLRRGYRQLRRLAKEDGVFLNDLIEDAKRADDDLFSTYDGLHEEDETDQERR